MVAIRVVCAETGTNRFDIGKESVSREFKARD
jgi:hypothetical protein